MNNEQNSELDETLETRSVAFSKEEISSAQAAEQMELTQAQFRHFNDRVVTLRAFLNRAYEEMSELRQQLSDAELRAEAYELALEEQQERPAGISDTI